MIDWSKVGKRSKGKGQRKQALARKVMDSIFGPTPFDKSMHHGHEERWQHMMGVEVKAGLFAEPIRIRYNKAMLQHFEAMPEDRRPFALIVCPDNSSRVLFVIEGQNLERLVEGIIHRVLGAADGA